MAPSAKRSSPVLSTPGCTINGETVWLAAKADGSKKLVRFQQNKKTSSKKTWIPAQTPYGCSKNGC